MSDIEDMGLKLFHIIPYRIVSQEYGDYPYEGEYEDEDGELIAETAEDLIDKIDDLLKRYILDWANGQRDTFSKQQVNEYVVRKLREFSYRNNDYDFFDDFATAPFNGAKYPKFGSHRIELREYADFPVDLDITGNQKDRLLGRVNGYVIQAAQKAHDTLKNIETNLQSQTIAAKREQFERLKRELGET